MIYEESLLYHYKDFKDEYLNKIQNNISVISHIINNDNSKAVSTNIYRLILKPNNQIQMNDIKSFLFLLNIYIYKLSNL